MEEGLVLTNMSLGKRIGKKNGYGSTNKLANQG